MVVVVVVVGMGARHRMADGNGLGSVHLKEKHTRDMYPMDWMDGCTAYASIILFFYLPFFHQELSSTEASLCANQLLRLVTVYSLLMY